MESLTLVLTSIAVAIIAVVAYYFMSQKKSAGPAAPKREEAVDTTPRSEE